MALAIKGLWDNVKEEVKEIKEGEIDKDLESGSGINFIKEGVHKVTIDKAFIKTTDYGASFTIHTKGENIYQGTIYPFKLTDDGKLTTTQEWKGKTSTIGDFKLLKQLYYMATGTLIKSVKELEMSIQDVTYTSYGQEVTEEGGVIDALTDKELYIGIRRGLRYRWDSDAEEKDKTQYAADDEGNLRYEYKLFSVYDKDGFSPKELVQKAEETIQKDKDDEYLKSDKGIKKPKLEVSDTKLPEIDVDDEIAF